MGSYGETGVHVFFILSGYLITKLLLTEYELSSTIGLRNFYVRRAYRIFPAALAFLVVVVALYWGEMRWHHRRCGTVVRGEHGHFSPVDLWTSLVTQY